MLQRSRAQASCLELSVAPAETLPVLEDIDTAADLCHWYRSSMADMQSEGVISESWTALLRLSKTILLERQFIIEALAETGYTVGDATASAPCFEQT